jgi:hypothetical protein
MTCRRSYTWILVLLLPWISGCVGKQRVTVYEPGPHPRGYLEFYVRDGFVPGSMKIYELMYGRRVYMKLSRRPDKNTRLLCTAMPGRHSYVILVGTGTKRVSVDVEENGVTPVMITFNNISQLSWGAVARFQFTFTVTPLASYPYSVYKAGRRARRLAPVF